MGPPDWTYGCTGLVSNAPGCVPHHRRRAVGTLPGAGSEREAERERETSPALRDTPHRRAGRLGSPPVNCVGMSLLDVVWDAAMDAVTAPTAIAQSCERSVGAPAGGGERRRGSSGRCRKHASRLPAGLTRRSPGSTGSDLGRDLGRCARATDRRVDGARFLTRDPLLHVTGEPYAYAANNPINMVDPLGLAPWDDLGGKLVSAWDATGGKAVSWANDNRSLAATAVAVVGYASCPVTAGLGCAVGTAASTAAVGFASADAISACRSSGWTSADCAMGGVDTALAAFAAGGSRFFVPGGRHFARGAFGLRGAWFAERSVNLSLTGGASFLSLSMHTLEDFFDARADC